MSARLFTSDNHFGHRFVSGVRGFGTEPDDISRHDQALISNWNTMACADDHIYVLGDFSLKSPPAINQWLSQLNGTKHLIWGNHDKGFGGNRQSWKWIRLYLDAGFSSVQSFLRLKINGKEVMLSHFPYDGDHTENNRYEQYRLRDMGLPLLHGHTHSNGIYSRSLAGTQQIHMGVDAWNLKPVTEGTIALALEINSGG
jgi:calcineurin-like phosphoesterase family protein